MVVPIPSPTEDPPRSLEIVAVVRDGSPVHAALEALEPTGGGVCVRARVASAAAAVAAAPQHASFICLVDATLPDGAAVETVRQLRRRRPATRIVAVCDRPRRSAMLAMLGAGAWSLVTLADAPERLLDAIDAAADDRRVVSPELVSGVGEELSRRMTAEAAMADLQRDRVDRIARALHDGSLSMVFQPISRLDDGEVVALEALARFDTPERRPPDVWFAEAAEVGRLRDLELAAVRAALAEAPRLPAGVALSVNVSPGTAGSLDLLDVIDRVQVPLIVEITEHAQISDYDGLLPQLARLRERGVRIAIDDAGAGFASFRHILRLAPDIIKTDLSLTRRIVNSHAERALIRALSSFAEETGATIVAEGIECEREVVLLQELGVRFGQGFHLGRPAQASPFAGRRALAPA